MNRDQTIPTWNVLGTWLVGWLLWGMVLTTSSSGCAPGRGPGETGGGGGGGSLSQSSAGGAGRRYGQPQRGRALNDVRRRRGRGRRGVRRRQCCRGGRLYADLHGGSRVELHGSAEPLHDRLRGRGDCGGGRLRRRRPERWRRLLGR